MPNHVHLILTPRTSDGLGRALGKAHRRYAGFVNARMRVTGHLFQSRFSSVAMDEAHLLAAARYVALNPVRAGWSGGPRIGGGRARRRIWPAATTGWLRSRRCWRVAAGASPNFWSGAGRSQDRGVARRRDDRPPAGRPRLPRRRGDDRRPRSPRRQARTEEASPRAGPGGGAGGEKTVNMQASP